MGDDPRWETLGTNRFFLSLIIRRLGKIPALSRLAGNRRRRDIGRSRPQWKLLPLSP
jgi:hypothetical protein